MDDAQNRRSKVDAGKKKFLELRAKRRTWLSSANPPSQSEPQSPGVSGIRRQLAIFSPPGTATAVSVQQRPRLRPADEPSGPVPEGAAAREEEEEEEGREVRQASGRPAVSDNPISVASAAQAFPAPGHASDGGGGTGGGAEVAPASRADGPRIPPDGPAATALGGPPASNASGGAELLPGARAGEGDDDAAAAAAAAAFAAEPRYNEGIGGTGGALGDVGMTPAEVAAGAAACADRPVSGRCDGDGSSEVGIAQKVPDDNNGTAEPCPPGAAGTLTPDLFTSPESPLHDGHLNDAQDPNSVPRTGEIGERGGDAAAHGMLNPAVSGADQAEHVDEQGDSLQTLCCPTTDECTRTDGQAEEEPEADTGGGGALPTSNDRHDQGHAAHDGEAGREPPVPAEAHVERKYSPSHASSWTGSSPRNVPLCEGEARPEAAPVDAESEISETETQPGGASVDAARPEGASARFRSVVGAAGTGPPTQVTRRLRAKALYDLNWVQLSRGRARADGITGFLGALQAFRDVEVAPRGPNSEDPENRGERLARDQTGGNRAARSSESEEARNIHHHHDAEGPADPKSGADVGQPTFESPPSRIPVLSSRLKSGRAAESPPGAAGRRRLSAPAAWNAASVTNWLSHLYADLRRNSDISGPPPHAGGTPVASASVQDAEQEAAGPSSREGLGAAQGPQAGGAEESSERPAPGAWPEGTRGSRPESPVPAAVSDAARPSGKWGSESVAAFGGSGDSLLALDETTGSPRADRAAGSRWPGGGGLQVVAAAAREDLPVPETGCDVLVGGRRALGDGAARALAGETQGASAAALFDVEVGQSRAGRADDANPTPKGTDAGRGEHERLPSEPPSKEEKRPDAAGAGAGHAENGSGTEKPSGPGREDHGRPNSDGGGGELLGGRRAPPCGDAEPGRSVLPSDGVEEAERLRVRAAALEASLSRSEDAQREAAREREDLRALLILSEDTQKEVAREHAELQALVDAGARTESDLRRRIADLARSAAKAEDAASERADRIRDLERERTEHLDREQALRARVLELDSRLAVEEEERKLADDRGRQALEERTSAYSDQERRLKADIDRLESGRAEVEAAVCREREQREKAEEDLGGLLQAESRRQGIEAELRRSIAEAEAACERAEKEKRRLSEEVDEHVAVISASLERLTQEKVALEKENVELKDKIKRTLEESTAPSPVIQRQLSEILKSNEYLKGELRLKKEASLLLVAEQAARLQHQEERGVLLRRATEAERAVVALREENASAKESLERLQLREGHLVEGCRLRDARIAKLERRLDDVGRAASAHGRLFQGDVLKSPPEPCGDERHWTLAGRARSRSAAPAIPVRELSLLASAGGRRSRCISGGEIRRRPECIECLILRDQLCETEHALTKACRKCNFLERKVHELKERKERELRQLDARCRDLERDLHKHPLDVSEEIAPGVNLHTLRRKLGQISALNKAAERARAEHRKQCRSYESRVAKLQSRVSGLMLENGQLREEAAAQAPPLQREVALAREREAAVRQAHASEVRKLEAQIAGLRDLVDLYQARRDSGLAASSGARARGSAELHAANRELRERVRRLEAELRRCPRPEDERSEQLSHNADSGFADSGRPLLAPKSRNPNGPDRARLVECILELTNFNWELNRKYHQLKNGLRAEPQPGRAWDGGAAAVPPPHVG